MRAAMNPGERSDVEVDDEVDVDRVEPGGWVCDVRERNKSAIRCLR